MNPKSFIVPLLVLLLVATIQTDSLSSQDMKIATFNTSLFRGQKGALAKELATGGSESAKKVAEILQIVRPDLVLLNEFDFDTGEKSIREFQNRYLALGQNGHKPIKYPYYFAPPVNTGVPSGMDLDNDGSKNGPGDAYGFGKFPGQYGFVVLSKFPIDTKETRTFQKFLWKDMPGAMLPENKDGTGFYSESELQRFRLSSKNHCDVVINVNQSKLHFLVSHPTPPVFDKEEDRNGRRNHDEIRFWNDYVTPGKSKYIYDDLKKRGGIGRSDARFVIAGDLNADPFDGDSTNNPIGLYQKNRFINFKVAPQSRGGKNASGKGRANQKHRGNPANDTADFNDDTMGNLRIDYALPSANLKVTGSGVFWPEEDDPQSRLTKVSDHRLVWISVDLE